MERLNHWRSRFVILLFVLLLSFFAFRLYDLQIIETGGVVDNTTTFTTWTRVKAARGEILDRNGNVMVGNRASYNLVINHFVLASAKSPNREIHRLVSLCKEMGIEYIDHFPVTMTRPFTYTIEQQSPVWQGYFQKFLANRGDLDSDISAPLLIQMLRDSYEIPEEWTDEEARMVLGIRYEMSLRNITTLSTFVFIEDANDQDLSAILELETPGITVEPSTVREYYTEYAAHILGYVGNMSDKQWEYYKDKGYSMDAEVGQTGFELAFEEALHATDGIRVDQVTADGTVIRSYYKQEPIAGNNVEVTIDLELQETAEKALAIQMEALRNQEVPLDPTEEPPDGLDAQGAAVVAIEVGTGQVLVCASYPTYHPESLRTDFDQLLEMEYDPLFNRALQGIYPPGSTYKMAMVVTGFHTGQINSETTIEDKGVFLKYPGFNPKCLRYANGSGTHGHINASEALCVSCNYFFYELGDRITIETIDNVAKSLGLGEKTGIEMYEEIGMRANPETKKQMYTGDQQRFAFGDKVLCAIGQSENKFTPMQLAVYTSTLANKGVRYRATFLNQIVSADYRTRLAVNEPEVVSTFPITDECYATYTKGMTMVTSYLSFYMVGTAYETFRDFPLSVAGKTGTAQHGISTASDHGAFVCYAPADSTPKIAIAIYGERAGHGSSMASVARSMLEQYFAVGINSSDVTANENQVS